MRVFWFSDDPTRSLAGLILKNNVRVHWDDFHESTRVLIRNECLEHVGDRSAMVRTTIGILVTAIVGKGMNLPQWYHGP